MGSWSMLSVYQGCLPPIVACWKMPPLRKVIALTIARKWGLDPAAVHTGELVVRALVVGQTLGRHQLAFDDDLGVGRHQEVDGLALHELRGMAVETAEDLEVVGTRRYTGQRGHLVDQRSAEHDRELEIASLGVCRGRSTARGAAYTSCRTTSRSSSGTCCGRCPSRRHRCPGACSPPGCRWCTHGRRGHDGETAAVGSDRRRRRSG